MRRQLTRRKMVFASGAAGASPLLLGGCRPGESGAPARQREAQPVKLIFGRRSSAAELPVLERYLATYRQVAPHVTVEMTSLPSGLQAMRQGLITAFAGSTGPDVFISDGPWLPEFANKGLLDAMPDRISRDLKANFTEGGQRYGTYKGVSYVYPYETVVHGLYYNRTLFTQAGLDPDKPPRTFAEFRDYARRTTKRDGADVVVAGFLGNDRLLYVENFVYNNGGRVINEDEYGNLRKPYKLTLGEPRALAALQLHHDLYNTDRAAPTKSEPNFQQGTVTMQVLTNGNVRSIKQRAPTLDYGVAPLPTQLSFPAHQLGGWSWGVAKPSMYKDPAWTLLQWLNTKENVLQYVETLAAVSTHKGVIADSRALSMDPERMKVFYQVLPKITHVRPKAVVWSEIEALAEPEVKRMFAGEMTPKQLLDKIEGPVNALLAKEP
ncbi:MAG: ABC transporter substrate-binding protein [Chloroflexi bacterium]|nr:ABC transporter substrate-binding protein [Chloroflexota bacterium]